MNNSVSLEAIKDFIVQNNIIGTTAGVSVGMVTNLLIQSLSSDIIVPSIIYLCYKLNMKWLTAILPTETEFSLNKFIKQLISWILTLLISFLFVKAAFEFVFGISHHKEKKTKPENTQKENVNAPKMEPFNNFY